jgi:hypothetical protein
MDAGQGIRIPAASRRCGARTLVNACSLMAGNASRRACPEKFWELDVRPSVSSDCFRDLTTAPQNEIVARTEQTSSPGLRGGHSSNWRDL